MASGAAAMGREVVGKGFYGVGTPPFGDKEHFAFVGVGKQGDVVVSTGPGGLIHGQAGDFGEISLFHCQFDVALADRGDTMPGQIHQTGHGGKRHLAAQGEDQRLEQQGEARQLASPVGFDQTHPAIGQTHPWHAYFEVALVLEEVEVPIALGHGVVRQMFALDARSAKPTAGNEIDADR